MNPKTEDYQCGKCKSGTITVVMEKTREYQHVSIKRCTNCKKQYGMKELYEEIKSKPEGSGTPN